MTKTSVFKINLGAHVEDTLTGFTGIVAGRSDWLYGCRRYVVQPVGVGADGKMFDSGSFDEDALQVLQDCTDYQNRGDFQFNLGAEAEDKVTGFTGVITGRSEWMHGCRRYVIQPKGTNKDGKIFETETFDEAALNLLKDFKEQTVSNTGGPQREISRSRDIKPRDR